MARALRSDYMQSMRFHVVVNALGEGGAGVAGLGTPDASFSAVTTPEETLEAVEYREGIRVFTYKYPGIPTMNDITMSRGVTLADNTFMSWVRLADGYAGGEYRIDFDIKHLHRLAQGGGTFNLDHESAPQRVYKVQNAFCIRHKVAGDLDATAGEISIMELDAGYEFFELEERNLPT